MLNFLSRLPEKLTLISFHSFVWLSVLLLAISSTVQAAENEYSVELSVNAQEYMPGDTLVYSLSVTNLGDNKIEGIDVYDPVANIQVEDRSGQMVPAFISVSNTSTQGSDPGSYRSSGNLVAVGASLEIGETLIYQITAKVTNDDIVGDIVNDSAEAIIIQFGGEGTLVEVADPASTPKRIIETSDYDYTVTLTASPEEYSVGGSIVYTLTIDNLGEDDIEDMDISNPVADIQVEDQSGNRVSAFSSVTNRSSQDSNAGDYNKNGNLEVTGANIDAGDSLTYTMTAQVVSGVAIVGDIVNDSAVTTVTSPDNASDQRIEAANSTTTPQIDADVSITHTLAQTTPYLVGDETEYTIVVSNKGGIAHNYHVQQDISDLITDLANDKIPEGAEDTTGNPYGTWQVSVTLDGNKSSSELLSSGTQVDQPLDDTISLYPNESLTYLVEVTVDSVSIGEIPLSTAQVTDAQGDVKASATASTLDTKNVLNSNSSKISIIKTTDEFEYSPGASGEEGWVEYTISVANSSSTLFANNITVVDTLSCIQTSQIDGSQGDAFSEWRLDVAEVVGDGTNAGAYNYGAITSEDINIIADLAPEGTIEYTLRARVSDMSIGTIVDNSDCGDTVVESGAGVKMPAPNLYVKKEADTSFYSPGETVTYTITVQNTGDGYAPDIPVIDNLNLIKVDSAIPDITGAGSQIPAYSSWSITSDIIGDEPTLSDTGMEGTITGNTTSITDDDALDVIATIAPGESVIYTVEAVINPYAGTNDSSSDTSDRIVNEASADGNIISDRGVDPYSYYLTLDKGVAYDNDDGSPTYADEAGYAYYPDADNIVTYYIRVENPTGNGYANDVEVKDEISNIQATLLDPDNTQVNAFDTWTITAKSELLNDASTPLVLIGAETGIDGEIQDQDLDVLATLPPGVAIVYTVTAHLNSTDDAIVYGSFQNTATINSEEDGSQSESATLYPRIPNLYVAKTANVPSATAGDVVTFDIYVLNEGAGYANNVDIDDDIRGLNYFSESIGWTIEIKEGGVGSNGDVYSTITQNTAGTQNIGVDIDTRADIAPNNGYVAYTVTGTVKDDYDDEQVTNLVDVYDPDTDREFEASVQIDNQEATADNIDVSLIKVTENPYFTPGEDFIYSIVVRNNDTTDSTPNLLLEDKLTEITATLANDKDQRVGDVYEASPFEYWDIDYDTTLNGTFVPDVTRSTDDILDLSIGSLAAAPGEGGLENDDNVYVLKIRARVKENTVAAEGTTDMPPIANTVMLTTDEDDTVNKIALVENFQVDNNGDKFYETNIKNYSPGDELIYTIGYVSQEGRGYRNNVTVNELIKDITVELEDGTTANPFEDPETGEILFTVSVDGTDDGANTHGDGTTDGTLDGVVADNENIETTIDIGAGDRVIYTVTGTIRPDAVGDIDYGGTTVFPNTAHLLFDKTTEEQTYIPGENINYHLTVVNAGEGNANDVVIQDYIDQVMVDTVSDTSEAAFTTWTIESQPPVGEYAEYVDAGVGPGQIYTSSDQNLEVDGAFIPAGHFIEYILTAKTIDIASGEITNSLNVNQDSVTNTIKQATDKINFEKTIEGFYDINGDPISGNAYMPGGYITYKVKITNISDGHINDALIMDDFSTITTDSYDGSTIPAFTRWRVEETAEDESGISDANIQNLPINQWETDGTLSVYADIAAEGFVFGGGVINEPFVEYTITAQIDPTAVGSIRNIAQITVDDETTYDIRSPLAHMAKSDITFTKQAYTDSSLSTLKTNYSQSSTEGATSGSHVVYHILLQNDGYGIEYDSTLTDTLSAINTAIAETAATNGTSPSGNPFENGWTLQATSGVVNADGSTTETNDTTSITEATGITFGSVVSDADIDSAITLAPREYMEFVIETDIRLDALGQVNNKASYDGNNRNASLSPLSTDLIYTKVVSDVGGRGFDDSTYYLPGDTVTYEIILANNSDNWADDVQVTDDFNNVYSEMIGGGKESAYVSGTIAHTITDEGIVSGEDTYVPVTNGAISLRDLNTEIDLAAGEEIRFTLTGVVDDRALSTIEENQLYVDGNLVESEDIPPAPSDVQAEKLLIYTDGVQGSCSLPSNTGDGCAYTSYGIVEYQVIVSNDGPGTANDVKVVDAINSIQTVNGDIAFSSYSVSVEEYPTGTEGVDYDINGNYQGNVPLNATVDLKAGDQIIFNVTGTISAGATGEMTNVATVDGVDTNEITLEGILSNVIVEKYTEYPNYAPGGPVIYYIDVTNNSGENAIFRLTDFIDLENTTTADGTEQVALQTWQVTSVELISDSSPDDASAQDISGLENIIGVLDTNIDVSDIQLAGVRDVGVGETANCSTSTCSTVRVTVEGVARDDAIGRFTNTAEIIHRGDTKIARLQGGANGRWIEPYDGNLVLTKEPYDIDTGTVLSDEEAIYTPGQPVSFKVTLTNDNLGQEESVGYLSELMLTDLFSTLETEIANSDEPGESFVSDWTISGEALTPPENANLLSFKANDVNDAAGYVADYRLHPGDSYSFILTGTVNENATGDVTNVVDVTDENGTDYTDDAIFHPVDATVDITKTVTTSTETDVTEGNYYPNEQVIYTVKVANPGLGWVEDVHVEDSLSEIIATASGGKESKVFDMGLVSATAVSETGETLIPNGGSLVGSDIDWTFDLAPADTITLTITATVEEKIIGEFTNTAYVTYSTEEEALTKDASATLYPQKALITDLTLEKTALDESDIEITTYNVVTPFYYEITLSNGSNAYATGIELNDLLSTITTDVVNENDGSVTSQQALSTWKVLSIESSDELTSITPDNLVVDNDLDNIQIDLAPNSDVVIAIQASSNSNAIGDINNVVTVDYNDGTSTTTQLEDNALLLPEEGAFLATKVAVESQYKPGEQLDFLITVENNSNSYLNDVDVIDNFDDVMVEYYPDNTLGPAFEEGTTSLTKVIQTNGVYVEQIDDDHYIVDIPPGGAVVFRARGTVVENAAGDIINTANVGDLEVPSNPVPSVPAVVRASFYTNNEYYIPGETIEYHLVVRNEGQGNAENVALSSRFAEAMGDIVNDDVDTVFTEWTIEPQVTNGADPGDTADNTDIATLVDIPSGGEIDYTIVATVNPDLVSVIEMDAVYADLTLGDVTSRSTKNMDNIFPVMEGDFGIAEVISAQDVPPIDGVLEVTKISDQSEYIDTSGENLQIIYTLTVVNTGSGNMTDVHLEDMISEIVAEDGDPIFTEWTVVAEHYDSEATPTTRTDYYQDQDINNDVDFKNNSRESYTFTITAILNVGIDEPVTNTFSAYDPNGIGDEASVTNYVQTTPTNEGEMLLTKKVMQDDAQVGDVVEYEVTVENGEDSLFEGVIIEDRYPGGFVYVPNTTEIVFAGDDGTFDTIDDEVINQEPSNAGVLKFGEMDFDLNDKVRIRYLLRVSVGVTFGDYVNTAVAKVDTLDVSNEDSAVVTIEPDKVFDTAAIIGKVFEDHNGDGFQADATAFDVEASMRLSDEDYINGSVKVIYGDGEEETIDDSDITDGIDLDDIWGLSHNRTLPNSNRVTIQLQTRTRQGFDLLVTSDSGSHIKFNTDNEIDIDHSSDRAKGLSAENLDVTRNLYRVEDQYLWEIVIENRGFYEDGIPGVKLMTVEGTVIETDQYGRYHVPDSWVLNDKGKNFLVKLDTDSLPTGMEVVSENPKVLRITPNKLTKFNFSVRRRGEG